MTTCMTSVNWECCCPIINVWIIMNIALRIIYSWGTPLNNNEVLNLVIRLNSINYIMLAWRIVSVQDFLDTITACVQYSYSNYFTAAGVLNMQAHNLSTSLDVRHKFQSFFSCLCASDKSMAWSDVMQRHDALWSLWALCIQCITLSNALL